MPIVAKQIDIGSTLEQIRQQFNNLQSDVTTLQASPTYGTSIIFEGTTNDDYETSLTAQDPTADRTIYLPNENGTVLTTASVVNSDTSTITANNSTDETVYPVFVDGATGTQGLETDNGFSYNPLSGDLRIINLVIDDGGIIGSATDRNAIAISSAGVVTLSATDSLSVTGTSTFNEDVTFTGAAYNMVWDKSANSLEFADGGNAYWGTDLIYDSSMTVLIGIFKIQAPAVYLSKVLQLRLEMLVELRPWRILRQMVLLLSTMIIVRSLQQVLLVSV